MITVMHISDLHIGAMIRWFGSFGPRLATRAPTSMPSKRGHDERVAQDLSMKWIDILEQAAKEGAEARIAVTGDLTRSGTGEQFGLAHRYIHASWLIDPSAPDPWEIGLQAGGNLALTIPGNHDFWNGMVLGSIVWRNVLEPHFWTLPWLHVVEDVKNELEIHFVGLDSCSGLSTLSFSQVLATGAIDKKRQLDPAETLLDDYLSNVRTKNPNRVVVRVVLVHHPPERLTTLSRFEFERWLSSNHVHAILTGHTHVPLQQDLPNAAPCFELRCGTTLQAGTDDKLPGRKPNHFYLHRIDRERSTSKEVTWKTLEYWHNGAKWDAGLPPPPLVWNRKFVGL